MFYITYWKYTEETTGGIRYAYKLEHETQHQAARMSWILI